MTLPIVPARLISYHLACALSGVTASRGYASVAESSGEQKAYSHTLLLPRTSLPLRHKHPAAFERTLRSRTTEELYRIQFKDRSEPIFILHDGPPYANGNLHMGHALNRVLKDIITRYNVSRGRKVHYRPGWDCHGLPIEQKALLQIGGSHTSMQPTQIRNVARRSAHEAIDIQKQELLSLGIMADWGSESGTYRTMDSDYEMRQLRLFKTMVEKGFISYRHRPTFYSPSSRTALAEAELSYKSVRSRSVYVTYSVSPMDMSGGLKKAYEEACQSGDYPLKLAIWTTTPWSLPGNEGVAVHNDGTYVLAARHRELLVIMQDRLGPMQEVLGELTVVASLTGRDLIGTRYTHLFHTERAVASRPFIFHAQHVTAQSGTGLVHAAPAHGHEDYLAFVQAGILPAKMRCPIDDAGRFTSEVLEWSDQKGTDRLVGAEVLERGVDVMIALLRDSGALLAEQSMEHRYPCDWKTKEPIIVRATPQWFADVEAVKPRAIQAMKSVRFHPPQSRHRLESFVLSRSEWCISRQRSWGVPIPALYDSDGEPLLNGESLDHILSVLQDKGMDHWWSGPVSDFVPPAYKGQDLRRGIDTLDVWFDSGTSWTQLLGLRDGILADVYLEGSDQHRGWFQSSLLTRLGVTETALPPYRDLITHGMVLDEEGQKMSKSAGNGISPVDIVNGSEATAEHGADTLRLWAASVDYQRDVSIGPSSIAQASEALRKLRSVARFLLGNINEASLSSEVKRSPLDRYIVSELATLSRSSAVAYESFNFNKVTTMLHTFASNTLSALYFDVIKDTLYCEKPSSLDRQAILSTMTQVFNGLIKIIAPITPFLAEELYEAAGGKLKSVFLEPWTEDEPNGDHSSISAMILLRSQVLALTQQARGGKNLRSAAESDAYLSGEESAMNHIRTQWDSLPRLLGVAAVHLGEPETNSWSYNSESDIGMGRVSLTLVPTIGNKCPRCWLYVAKSKDTLCNRCESVLV